MELTYFLYLIQSLNVVYLLQHEKTLQFVKQCVIVVKTFEFTLHVTMVIDTHLKVIKGRLHQTTAFFNITRKVTA